ncbi:response regulator transcription factor [Variovorax sp. NFACC27]|uniref:response regulator transcription factor n=1 Tax=unclassified Variovorax TaxID=663243 RepID=UPI000898F433|nr:response regulator transcription factor [Variovorax sp. YR750]SEF21252.1 two component transcriptional regulator, LuxR family [Variovorax sp. NFACC28]SEF46340.1 two component transcriptional regulator, LuxR family [Variovorax sp. NFACC29]SFB66914.1 two component transcriptional regulator, LuxR family [Variovorax sp. NFACC26]SFG47676.1 two component transcriptional regulator, LuxR family [Variovorax sp. NFACC27]SEK82599.1 two component transcriptional regulator, LuxR family [Variovorax sp. Y
MEMNIPYTTASARPVPTAAQLYGGVFHAALIVADDSVSADRMRRILCDLAPHRRVVVASGRAEAFNLLAALPYDLVLVDMRLPGNDGVAVLQHVRQAYPRIESVGMSATDDQQLVNAAIAAGAIGYLLTETDDAELGYLLRSIERGGSPMDSRIARRILGSIAASAKARTIEAIRVQGQTPQQQQPHQYQQQQHQQGPDSRLPQGLLSPRELKVLRLIAQGWSNRQIAEAVYLSVNTIEFHAKSIYRKLSVKSRTQAVHEAMQHGLLN